MPYIGDSVWSESSRASRTVSFTIRDWARSIFELASESSPALAPAAEWIVERTCLSGNCDNPLPDFGTIQLQNSIYQQRTTWNSISLGGGAAVDSRGLDSLSQNFSVKWDKGY